MSRLTVSLVVYKSNLDELELLLRSLGREPCVCGWVVVDNGGSEEVRDLTEKFGGRYIWPGANIGFGAGHNLAVKTLSATPSEYHLFVNPDIAFADGSLGELVAMMEKRPDVGLVMPKVHYPDGRIQRLCKLLPNPADLALRRFCPGLLKRVADRRIAKYEMRDSDPDVPAYIPFLSGCFMFTRREVFESTGGFDDRFFLYMEDVDLCRRISEHSRLLYWPPVAVTHVYQRASHTNLKLTLIFIRSAITYFNKWGWILDRERRRSNRDALAQMHRLNPRD